MYENQVLEPRTMEEVMPAEDSGSVQLYQLDASIQVDPKISFIIRAVKMHQ